MEKRARKLMNIHVLYPVMTEIDCTGDKTEEQRVSSMLKIALMCLHKDSSTTLKKGKKRQIKAANNRISNKSTD